MDLKTILTIILSYLQRNPTKHRVFQQNSNIHQRQDYKTVWKIRLHQSKVLSESTLGFQESAVSPAE